MLRTSFKLMMANVLQQLAPIACVVVEYTLTFFPDLPWFKLACLLLCWHAALYVHSWASEPLIKYVNILNWSTRR